MPPDHAGHVILHFIRGDGRILIDGMWTYGDGRAADWQTNFYGVSIDTAPEYDGLHVSVIRFGGDQTLTDDDDPD